MKNRTPSYPPYIKTIILLILFLAGLAFPQKAYSQCTELLGGQYRFTFEIEQTLIFVKTAFSENNQEISGYELAKYDLSYQFMETIPIRIPKDHNLTQACTDGNSIFLYTTCFTHGKVQTVWKIAPNGEILCKQELDLIQFTLIPDYAGGFLVSGVQWDPCIEKNLLKVIRWNGNGQLIWEKTIEETIYTISNIRIQNGPNRSILFISTVLPKNPPSKCLYPTTIRGGVLNLSGEEITSYVWYSKTPDEKTLVNFIPVSISEYWFSVVKMSPNPAYSLTYCFPEFQKLSEANTPTDSLFYALPTYQVVSIQVFAYQPGDTSIKMVQQLSSSFFPENILVFASPYPSSKSFIFVSPKTREIVCLNLTGQELYRTTIPEEIMDQNGLCTITPLRNGDFAGVFLKGSKETFCVLNSKLEFE